MSGYHLSSPGATTRPAVARSRAVAVRPFDAAAHLREVGTNGPSRPLGLRPARQRSLWRRLRHLIGGAR